MDHFSFTENDLYFSELYRDFLPQKVIDAHMHLWMGETIPTFYGEDGYLSVYARCFPEISKKFWKTYTEGNIREAASVIERYEQSLIRIWDKMHFDAVNHALQELAGIGTRYRRAPYIELNDAQMEELKIMLESMRISF